MVKRAALLAILLAGCGSVPAKSPPKTITIEVPVRESCLKGAPVEPGEYADSKLPKDPDKGPERYQRSAAGSAQREAFLASIRPWLAACR